MQETFISLGLGSGSVLGGLVVAALETPRAGMLACMPFALAGIVALRLVERHLTSARAT